MLTLFPEERPVYVTDPDPNAFFAKSTLKTGGVYLTCVTTITKGGVATRGEARVKKPAAEGFESIGKCQKLVRLSFYRAAVPALRGAPPWGALTGIRPGRLMTDMLLEGEPQTSALRRMVEENYVTRERAEMALSTAKASIKAQNSLDPRDICLYIGIPFCPTRCTYCSFVSNSVEKSQKLISPYLQALNREISVAAKTINDLDLNVIALYIGGGTPTTLTAEQLRALLERLSECLDLSRLREYTVEAGRPDTITAEKLDEMAKRGVSRISINPQSMQAQVLNAIGRSHTPSDVLEALELASNYNFLLNMDLIAGLPTDTAAGFRETLDTVMSYNPENITVHTLALKKGAKIMLEGTAVPDDGTVGEMVDYSRQTLTARGYSPYYLYRQKFISGGFENVGYALKGAESIYNICIMEQLCSIIALGAGGATKLVNPAANKIDRIFNPKFPYEYINRESSALAGEMIRFYQNEVFSWNSN